MRNGDTLLRPDPVTFLAGQLVSYRDRNEFSEEAYQQEQQRIYAETAVEREWLRGAQSSYEDTPSILAAVEAGLLIEITPQPGLMPIQRLLDWEPARDDPDHDFYYSPPFLTPKAGGVLNFVGRAWFNLQKEKGEPFIFLPVTSLVRSTAYQQGLSQRGERRIAIDTPGDQSSHEYGYAFDIDGCGLYKFDPTSKTIEAINPRRAGFDAHAKLIAEARSDLQGILEWLKDQSAVNVVEEVPGTKDWCFHVCVNPSADLDAILKP